VFDKMKKLIPPVTATITLDVDAPGRPVNRMVLGNNVQWVDHGDELLTGETTEFAPAMLEAVSALRPTVLRYPGGSNSDTYHWRDGMGPAAQRGECEHFHTKRKQKVLFGTAEFLTLCKRLGAEPLITVNVATGTAEEAAEWVRAVNKTGVTGRDGAPLGPVRYWEIGNEPYLREDQRKELAVEPEVYAGRANQFIRAMKQVDPTIVVGIPLRSDRLGSIPATPFQGFADKVLAGVSEPFEFVALHDAYLPILWDRKQNKNDDEVYRATMASYRVVEQDLEYTRSLLRKYKPDRPIKIAITEYNSLFSIGGNKDGYIATLGGGLYVGDALRLFAQTDDLLMANFWSLAGNWNFGTVSIRMEKRPAYWVLLAYQRALRGRLVPATVAGSTFDSPAAGMVPAYRGLPLVTALATVEGDTLRVLVTNKDSFRPARITLQGVSRAIAGIDCQQLGGGGYFEARSGRGEARLTPLGIASQAFPVPLNLGPHSMALIEIRLAK